jgi:nucleotide-binding universal stress UspA family protein
MRIALEPPPYSGDLTYVPMGEGFPTGPMKKELDALAKNTIEPELLKTVLVRVGTAFEVITNVARDCEADLIVITTHGSKWWASSPMANSRTWDDLLPYR